MLSLLPSREDLDLARRLALLRAGTVGLALLGDPVARLFQAPWRYDPYETYAALRARGPLVWSRSGIWVATDFATCDAVVRDRRFGVQLSNGQQPFDVTGGPMDPQAEVNTLELSLLGLDDPDHARLRRLATPAFSARRVAAMRPTVEATAARLLDRLDLSRTTDLMTDFATPLPVAVISDLMAIPPADQQRLAAWGRTLGAALDGVSSVGHAKKMYAAQADLRELFDRLLDERRREPGDDLLSRLVDPTLVEPVETTADEVVSLAQLLLLAGFETTTNLIGNALRHLLAHPEQLSAARRDPAALVAETLRYDPPVQLTGRVAHEPLELAGHRIKRDQVVLVLIGSSGRDAAKHDDPDTFDVARPEPETLAFSGGAHYCVGASLARLEGEVALGMLLRRFPDLRLAGRPVPRSTTVIRGLQRLSVRA
ncbi:cytochrome P450 [Nocardioides marmoraquaticus]